MSKTFYRVYRPQKFDELVGQNLIRLTLKQAIKESRIAHAYLFTGPRGTGKTTTARIFAKAVNCLTPLKERENAEPCDKCKNCLALMGGKTLDLMEIDAASYTGVDNIRQLTENIDLSPADLKYRIFIIDEVHMLSRGAFNALLKTLEEPPAHTIFILATTEQHKVPPTITSRCQRFSFSLLSLPEILEKLSVIAKKEKLDIDKESLEMISEAAHGGMRDAESLLAQVASLAGKEINAGETRDILGIAGRDDEIKLMTGLFEKNLSETVNQLEQMNKNGMDMFLLSHRLLDYLRKIIYLKLNPKGANLIAQEISESQVDKLKKLAVKISVTDLLGLTGKVIQTQPGIKNSTYPHLALELALVEWGIKDAPLDTTKEEKPAKSAKAGEPKKKIKKEKAEINEVNKPSNVSLKTVLSKWAAVLQNVKELQPALFSLLKACSPVKIEDDTLVISTPFKFHKDKLSDGKNRAVFCQELNKEVGISRICVVQDNAVPNSKANGDEMLDQVKSLLAG